MSAIMKVDNRTFWCDIVSVNGREFIRRARRYAKKTGQECRFEAGHGKGSHGRLYVGKSFTTVKRNEIDPALLGAMLKQLKIRKEDF